MISQEIERKFLVKKIPSGLKKYKKKKIVQGYLDVGGGRWIRMRNEAGTYLKTEKIGKGVSRKEIENEIPKKEFKELFKKIKGNIIKKIRYYIPYKSLIIEFNIFQGKFKGHLTAEVEFKTIKESKKFVAPDWFGKELTNDERYKNLSLALKGLP